MNAARCMTRVLQVALAVAFLRFGGLALGQAEPSPAARPATDAKPAGKVVATVNGEPILESELLAALPDDTFADQLAEIKRNKLERLIDQTFQAQFLKERKITVSDDQIDQETIAFHKMIRTPGCPCCGGGYASLEQYMTVNSVGESEFYQRLWNNAAWKIYSQKLASRTLSKEALAAATARFRQQIEADTIKCSAILFDCTQDPRYNTDPDGVSAAKKKLAGQAWQRLNRHEAFEKVAQDMSDPKYAAVDAGVMDCIPAKMLGNQVQIAWRKLKPGTYSEPVETPWGYCIVKRGEFTEEEMASLILEKIRGLMVDQTLKEYQAAKARAKIQVMSP